MPNRASVVILAVAAGIASEVAVEPSAAAQDKKVTQTAGVDNTAMGAYRALAQLSLRAFERGDMATAAELARILERTWDGAEERGGDRALSKRNKDLFNQLDSAMDAFIKPIIQYAAKPPDSANVKMAYNTFQDGLKRAD
jgi:hypothetical protein